MKIQEHSPTFLVRRRCCTQPRTQALFPSHVGAVARSGNLHIVTVVTDISCACSLLFTWSFQWIVLKMMQQRVKKKGKYRLLLINFPSGRSTKIHKFIPLRSRACRLWPHAEQLGARGALSCLLFVPEHEILQEGQEPTRWRVGEHCMLA